MIAFDVLVWHSALVQTKEYTTIDKTNWPRGEWDQEPDKVQWQDQATGMPCLAVRQRESGHWCGYVGVTKGHPGFETEDVDVDVHGGITFGAFCQPSKTESHGICHIPDPGEPEHVWWLGFDCHHLGDNAPNDDDRFREHCASYRSLHYVQSECARLAKQLKEMIDASTAQND